MQIRHKVMAGCAALVLGSLACVAADLIGLVSPVVAETLIIALLLGGAVGALAWFQAAVARPLAAITAAIEQTASGEADVAIPACAGGDEIARLCAALAALRTSMAENFTLKAANEEMQREADQTRITVLNEMAAAIRAQSSEALDAAAERGRVLQGLFNELESAAAQTETEAARVADAAGASGRATETASRAAGGLAAAMQEVTTQIARSTEVTRRAVDAAGQASAVIDSLSDAVAAIAEVSRLIGDVARRTNLLALNATIEAARAGEAGKGFAVVAGEVKTLASQTARSTEEIDARIGAIRSAGEQAAASVRAIVAAIAEVDAISGGIGSSVEEQTAATAEIARAIESVSGSASDVAERIDTVNILAATSGGNINLVSSEVSLMRDKIEGLKEALIGTVDRALTQAERRRGRRIRVALEARIADASGTESARIEDLSAGGARAVLDQPRMMGEALRLAIAGAAGEIEARQVAQEGAVVRVAFADQAQACAVLASVVPELAPPASRAA